MFKRLFNFFKDENRKRKSFSVAFIISQIINKLSSYAVHELKLNFFSSLALKTYDYRKEYINKFINIHFDNTIQKKSIDKSNTNMNYDKVWVIWWQGLDNAPDIVKACIKSIKENSGKDVKLITFDNYKNYVSVPAKIIEKLVNGDLSLTHFADYYRMLLLKKYGGIYLDATIFCGGSLDFIDKDFWTIKTNNIANDFARNPANGRWSTFALASQPNGELVSTLAIILEDYFLSDLEYIDYFFLDFLIAYIYEHSEDIRQQLEEVAINNIDVFKLNTFLNSALIPNASLDTPPAILNKLTYKGKYVQYTKENELTIYSKLTR